MASLQENPYKRYKLAKKASTKLTGEKAHEMAMKVAKKSFSVGHVKHSGTFQGKSNALGQGGRAAQLKARGVPGGVIGNMARSVGAAPGGPNYHKKKSSGRKEPTISMGDDIRRERGGKKRKGTIGFADIEKKQAPHMKQTLRARKSSKKKHSSMAIKGMKNFMSEEAKEKTSKRHKSSDTHHKCKGAMCKNAEHSKKA